MAPEVAERADMMAGPFLRSGQLVRILEEWSVSIEGLYLYYPGHRQVPAELRSLIDMIHASPRVRTTVSASENPFAAAG